MKKSILKFVKQLLCFHDYQTASVKDVLTTKKRFQITTYVCAKCGKVIIKSNV